MARLGHAGAISITSYSCFSKYNIHFQAQICPSEVLDVMLLIVIIGRAIVEYYVSFTWNIVERYSHNDKSKTLGLGIPLWKY